MSGMPLYLSLQNEILAAIARGEYVAGDLLPTEQEYCERFGVSRATVRKALQNLSTDGRVVRKHGIGTYVHSSEQPGQSVKFRGFLEDVLVHDPENRFHRVYKRECRFPEAILDLFGDNAVPEGSVSLSTVSRRGQTIMAGLIHLPAPSCDHDTEAAYATSEQPTVVMLRKAGIYIARGQQRIQPIIVEQDIATLLGVSVGIPLLRATRVYFDIKGRAVAVIQTTYHPTNHEMVIDLLPR
ncbi:HTH-type transcriptional repressor YvoA [Antarctobacter heliothermus]|uniref:HTH-type transcriptional repressor YvoA n=1 Tax=Antarctobacter heliothermus TaxID=74033 RepID=A0A222E396_9RHOB|nr:GntR family transcriptional regulator [Antarctobacter heliothermus]ASP20458.1 HTH-type transcriptional repressor YvoA [Antarctobacter heliothermus]